MIRIVPLVALAVLTWACAPEKLPGGLALVVDLHDSAIGVSATSLPAGRTVIGVRNVGTEVHELEIFRTDLPADGLPVDASRQEAKKIEGLVKEIEEISPGREFTTTVNFRPGSYVLICNVPQHYQRGMHAALVVG